MIYIILLPSPYTVQEIELWGPSHSSLWSLPSPRLGSFLLPLSQLLFPLLLSFHSLPAPLSPFVDFPSHSSLTIPGFSLVLALSSLPPSQLLAPLLLSFHPLHQSWIGGATVCSCVVLTVAMLASSPIVTVTRKTTQGGWLPFGPPMEGPNLAHPYIERTIVCSATVFIVALLASSPAVTATWRMTQKRLGGTVPGPFLH